MSEKTTFWVKWHPFIDAQPNKECSIESTEINQFNFQRFSAFNEYITPAKYFHPYFDFDHFESLGQYESVLKWPDSLVSEFGQYSIGGYSNNSEINSKLNLKYIEKSKKSINSYCIL